ncbi:hypothetical protein D3C79_778260 [compost metagenome]
MTSNGITDSFDDAIHVIIGALRTMGDPLNIGTTPVDNVIKRMENTYPKLKSPYATGGLIGTGETFIPLPTGMLKKAVDLERRIKHIEKDLDLLEKAIPGNTKVRIHLDRSMIPIEGTATQEVIKAVRNTLYEELKHKQKVMEAVNIALQMVTGL